MEYWKSHAFTVISTLSQSSIPSYIGPQEISFIHKLSIPSSPFPASPLQTFRFMNFHPIIYITHPPLSTPPPQHNLPQEKTPQIQLPMPHHLPPSTLHILNPSPNPKPIICILKPPPLPHTQRHPRHLSPKPFPDRMPRLLRPSFPP